MNALRTMADHYHAYWHGDTAIGACRRPLCVEAIAALDAGVRVTGDHTAAWLDGYRHGEQHCARKARVTGNAGGLRETPLVTGDADGTRTHATYVAPPSEDAALLVCPSCNQMGLQPLVCEACGHRWHPDTPTADTP